MVCGEFRARKMLARPLKMTKRDRLKPLLVIPGARTVASEPESIRLSKSKTKIADGSAIPIELRVMNSGLAPKWRVPE